jgi:hypothetical protein
MDYIQPCKGRILSCFLEGTDLQQYVNKISVYESLTKSFLTARIRIIDNNNLMENLNVVGGEQMTFAFDSPPNDRRYEQKMHILDMKGSPADNLKSIIYDIDLIGKTYFQDKANLVQDSHKNTTGTAAISKIWNQYLNADQLKILLESTGMIGTQDHPTTTDNEKPLSAIYKLMKLLTFGSVQTGNPLLFRDRENVNLAPLQYLYDTLSAQETYIQKETWGANFFDPLIYNAIIHADSEVNPTDGEGGGRSALQDIAATKTQGQIVFDMYNGTLAVNKRAGSISSPGFGSGKSIGSLVSSIAGGVLSASAGSLGGSPNIQATHSKRWPRATAPDTKTMAEKLYSAEARGGPMLRLKVPLQTGINATVGKGVKCQLVPPIGDLTNANMYSYGLSGNWLAKEVCHEVYADDREVQATTSMLLMRGGLGN